jgi:hypothetical protein
MAVSVADDFTGTALPLDEGGLQQALGVIGVGAAELWAVLGVETTGCGFLPDRRPKILFERHVFSRETGHRFDASNPDLSDPRPGGYGPPGAAQYARLLRATTLDRQAALRSASWGIGQVMGYNAVSAGYPDVEQMVAAMIASEGAQLMAMVRFVGASQLDGALRTHDWPGFARGYNGPNYAINSYDTRLASAYERFFHGGLPDLTVRAAQVYLLYLGYEPGPIDGVLGRFTRSAMNDFQEQRSLPVTEALDDPTSAALQRAVAGD